MKKIILLKYESCFSDAQVIGQYQLILTNQLKGLNACTYFFSWNKMVKHSIFNL